MITILKEYLNRIEISYALKDVKEILVYAKMAGFSPKSYSYLEFIFYDLGGLAFLPGKNERIDIFADEEKELIKSYLEVIK